ncbi:hypothetical protein JCM19045_4010 [Bacillus sp. JCM 19045]|nr:hypothetical protein JCM19045_4010 [Bacillus sp. JCM 19045]
MIKSFFMISAISTSILFLAACTSEVQDDLLNYLNGDEMEELAQMEREIIDDYDTIATSTMEDSEAASFLDENVIAPYEAFISALEEFDISTTDVQEVHDIYIEAAGYQLEGFFVLKDGLEASDFAIIEEGNELLAEGRALIDRYASEIETLADENNIELEEE